MKILAQFFKWLIGFLLGRSAEAKIEEVKDEAKDEVDKIPDGDAIADYIND